MPVLAETTNTPEAWSSRAGALLPWVAVGWSREGQEERFKAVLRHLDIKPGDSVLDFGCGTGRFAEFLPPDVRYFAWDWADGMRERCRRDHPYARMVEPWDWPIQYDHVVAIGTFNLPGSERRTLIEIQRLWKQTRKTLAVSLYRGEDERCLRYRPTTIARLARSLTKRYVIDANYLDNDLLLVAHR